MMLLFIILVFAVMMLDEIRRDIKSEMSKEQNRLMTEKNGSR